MHLTEETREQPAEFKTEINSNTQIYAVCDGMGGEQMGETASLLAVQTIGKYAAEFCAISGDMLNKAVSRYVCDANLAICKAGNTVARMGTTLALLVLTGKNALVCNVGDSRVYQLRSKKLSQLSEEHTSAAQSVKFGILTPEQAKTHPKRGTLTQYLGVDPDEMLVEPYIASIKVKRKDIFLICSDGLSNTLNDTEIAGLLNESKTPAEAASVLMDTALGRGCKDNITVIVIYAS